MRPVPQSAPTPSILATGYADAVSALQSVGDLKGKVVIDITNPLTADYMGLTLGHSTSAAEEIAKAVPGADVVKAFNTVFAQVLGQGADFGNGSKVTVFVASDSERRQADRQDAGREPGLHQCRRRWTEERTLPRAVAGLNIYFAYGAGRGTAIAPAWQGF